MAVPYHKLRPLETSTSFDEDVDEAFGNAAAIHSFSRSSRAWWRIRRVPIRRRLKVRLPGLRRLLRRKARLVASVRMSWTRVMQRFKEGQEHFGDLFAGNYLFLQVNPTPVKKYIARSYALGVYGGGLPSSTTVA